MKPSDYGLPGKKYHIIYADPPWTYRDKRKSGQRLSGGAENHYLCMPTEEIKSLPVTDIAEDNCVLFLWVTFPMLMEGLGVIKAWGFQYKTLGFSWIKTNKNNSLFFGIGAYAKSNCEVCLMGIRGNVGRRCKDNQGGWLQANPKEKLSVVSNYISSAVVASREKHSQKPSEVRDRIAQLFGEVSRIELFAREKVDGWDAWGDET